MSSSPAIEEPEPAKARKGKKDKKEKKRDRADKIEKRERKEKKHRRDDDGDELDRTSKKRKSSDPDQSSKKHIHARTESQVSPAAQPTPSSTAQPRTKNQKLSTVTVTSRDQLLLQHTPFLQQRTSLYLPLSPAAHAFPLQGLCAEHLSPLLLTYYPPLHGVVLAYSDPRLSESPEDPQAVNISIQSEDTDGKSRTILAKSVNEYAASYTWLTATFTIFRPKRGTYLEGTINLQNESLLGMVCYNYFNAVVEREELPEGWRWVDAGDEEDPGDTGLGGGHYVDGEGKMVQGKVVLKVVDFELVGGIEGGGASISIVGSLKEG